MGDQDDVRLIVSTLDMMRRKWHFTPVVLFPKTSEPCLVMGQTPIMGHPTKLISTLQNCQDHQKSRKV